MRAVERDKPDADIRRVVIGESFDVADELLADPVGADNRERRTRFGMTPGHGLRLQHAQGEKRDQTIRAAFGRALDPRGIRMCATLDQQVGARTFAFSWTLDLPTTASKQLRDMRFQRVVALRWTVVWRLVHHGHLFVTFGVIITWPC